MINRVFEGVAAVASRGMVMTEVMDGIVRNIMARIYVSERAWTVRCTWDKPIPEAQNDVTKKALLFKPQFIWFVEEDTVPPKGILDKMLARIEAGADVVTVDYRLPPGIMATQREDGEVLYSGMGCLLVKAKFFDQMEFPWFETGFWTRVDKAWAKIGGTPKYGSQDISLFTKLAKLGAVLSEVEGVLCRHLRLKALGEKHTNNGLHVIEEL